MIRNMMTPTMIRTMIRPTMIVPTNVVTNSQVVTANRYILGACDSNTRLGEQPRG